MASPELITYIKEQIAAGVTPDDIKTTLISAGWAENDVNDSLAQFSAHTRTSRSFRYVLTVGLILIVGALGVSAYYFTTGSLFGLVTSKQKSTSNVLPYCVDTPITLEKINEAIALAQKQHNGAFDDPTQQQEVIKQIEKDLGCNFNAGAHIRDVLGFKNILNPGEMITLRIKTYLDSKEPLQASPDLGYKMLVAVGNYDDGLYPISMSKTYKDDYITMLAERFYDVNFDKETGDWVVQVGGLYDTRVVNELRISLYCASRNAFCSKVSDSASYYQNFVLDNKNNTIKIISPNGKEVWKIGAEKEIRWTASSDIPRVDIYIHDLASVCPSERKNDNECRTVINGDLLLARNLKNTGSYTWRVGDVSKEEGLIGPIITGDYKIGIIKSGESTDVRNADVSDDSFKIE